jgi:hypothetical protein
VDTAHKKADEAGFNHKVFGPYLAIDTSPENEIVIKKLPTTKLERALEIRNEASEKEKAISEIMSEQDKEFFDAQRADTEILNEQNDNKDVDVASLKEGIKSDMFRKMFEDNPQEFLKFVAEQFYGVANGQFTNTEAPTDALVSSFGEKVLEAAFEAYPLESLLIPEGLPAIYPSC